ncbi:MAG: hypothetical protein IJM44_01065 [Ruminococcus sp.]|nr:hypothetical protein [Ruminococcus sp.]
MTWVIRNRTTGQYLASKRMTVFADVFARRFNSVKQARAYIAASCKAAADWEVCELADERSGAMVTRGDISCAVESNFFPEGKESSR